MQLVAVRTGPLARLHTERIGVLVICLVTLLAGIHLLRGGMLVGQDSATQFYPWYSYLGERLRAGEFPGWNGAQFAGAPFAADPQSGWTYLPAMVIFTLLPLPFAAPVFVLGHLLLAGGATYALSRVLGMPVAAASVAAVAYELTGPVFGRSVCCPAAMEVATWVPTALLGVEVAVQARSWTSRLGGWTISGLAISQVLGAWLGQGSYYLLLVVGSYLAYRTVLSRDISWSARVRAGRLVGHGAAVLLLGFGLGAAGMLPRLAYVARSNVASGEYSGHGAWAAVVGGATPGSVIGRLLQPQFYYPGVATLALALIAVILARSRYGAPYFLALSIAGMVLAVPRTTPLHDVLYATLPRFEDLHRHWPERVMLVVFIAPAMLAGAAVSELSRRAHTIRWERFVVAVPAVAVIALAIGNAGVPVLALAFVACVVTIVAGLMATPSPPVRRLLIAGLVVLVAADLLLAGRAFASRGSYGGFHRFDLGSDFGSSGASSFLRDSNEVEPARYFGYDPGIATVADGYTVPYRYQFAELSTRALLVNNRATLLGLEDVQGYNPVQPQRYVEYITALNGREQEYHDANIFDPGLASPLLNLLNARYIVVPNALPPDRADLRDLRERHSTVYADEQVRVLENVAALPRAWVVHEARQVPDADLLQTLSSGAVDPRTTALLEVTPPPLGRPADPATSFAQITSHSADALTVTTDTRAAGMLVLSEMFDPDWTVHVNGKAASIYRANYLFRAVSVPAGVATVEFRYEMRTAQLGGAVTVGTIGAIIAGFVVLWRIPCSPGRPASDSRRLPARAARRVRAFDLSLRRRASSASHAGTRHPD